MSDSNEIIPDFAALATLPQDQPVVMVNLLAFREDGVECYRRYADEVTPHLERVGATVRYGGTMPATVLGEGDKVWWDSILLVEYPTPAAFIEMVSDPGYLEVHQHRADALVRGDLIATAHWSLVPAQPAH